MLFVIKFLDSLDIVFRRQLTTFNHLIFKFRIAFKCD
jgi:hypothetical protein